MLPSKKKMKARRLRPETVLIRSTEGKKYTDVLTIRDIRSKVKLDSLNVIIKAVKETRPGDVLLELSASPENKAKFSEALELAIGTIKSRESTGS